MLLYASISLESDAPYWGVAPLPQGGLDLAVWIPRARPGFFVGGLLG